MPVNSNSEIITRLVGKFSLEFENLPIDQLKVRHIIEEVLYNYNIITQETGLTTTDIDDKFQLYLLVKGQEGYSKRTLKNRQYELVIFARYLRKPLANVNLMDLRIYIADRCKNMQPNSMNHQISILRSFFAWLSIEDYIPKDPSLNLKERKVPGRIREPLTLYEMELLRQACPKVRDSLLVEFAYSTGCRVQEISDVNIKDLDFNDMSLHVIGKGDKEREVCFNTRTKFLLEKYLSERTDDNPSLFVTYDYPHNRLGIRAIERRITEIAKSANFTKSISPHVFRHTIATHLLSAGMPLHMVQIFLGHNDPKTTQIYAITSISNMKNEYRKLS